MKTFPKLAPLFLAAALLVPSFAFATSCTGPTDNSCGIGNVCQQDSNGFYACFSAPAASGSCTGLYDTSCGAGNSCQQDANGFYGCFPNANASSGLTGGTGTTGLTTNTNTSGAGGINTTYLQGYYSSIAGVINGILVPLLIAIAFITFLWGVYRYFILGADDDAKRQEGRTFVLYGIIGFVVIIAFWGLVGIVGTTIGLSAGGSAASHGITPPTL